MVKNQRTGMFGLPVHVEYCVGCTTSNQRPNTSIEFNNNSFNKHELNKNAKVIFLNANNTF